MALAAGALYDALRIQFGLFHFRNPLITVPAHHPAAPSVFQSVCSQTDQPAACHFCYLIIHAKFATDGQVRLAHDFAHGNGDYNQSLSGFSGKMP